MNDWDRIRSIITNYVKRGDPPIERGILIDAYPGAGKTTNVVMELMRLEQPFIYLAPNHEVIIQNVEFHNMEDYVGRYVHLKSRRLLCQKNTLRKAAEEYGMPIKPFCKSCDKRDTCEYYERRAKIEGKNPPPWAGVHAHITTMLRGYLFGDENSAGHADDYDIIVIEENPISALMHNVTLSLDDITFITNELGLMHTKHVEQVDYLLDLLDHLRQRLFSDFDYGRFWRRSVVEWRTWSSDEWHAVEEEFDLHVIARITNDGMNRAPVRIIGLLDLIMQETTRNLLEYHVRRHDPYGGHSKIMLSYYHGRALLSLPMHVVCLDGTADVEIWRNILAKDLVVERLSYKYQNVFQLKEGRYGITSWLTNHNEFTKTANNLLPILELIVRDATGDVLLVGNKRLCAAVSEHMHSLGLEHKCVLAWYYNLRSTNYLNCDTVVLMMKPQPPPDQIEVYVNLSGWTEETWTRYYTKDEMIQALARIRPNLKIVTTDGLFGCTRTRGDITIYVFSNEKIFTSDNVDVATYRMVKKYELLHMLQHGIETPRHMTRTRLRLYNDVPKLLRGNGGMTRDEIMRAVKCGRRIVTDVMNLLVVDNKVRCSATGTYEVI